MFIIPEPESSTKMKTSTRRENFQESARTEAVFIPNIGSEEELAHAAYLASLADPTQNGKLLAQAAIKKIGTIELPQQFDLIAASPISDLSGINLKGAKIREGKLTSIEKWVRKQGGHIHSQVHGLVKQLIARGDSVVVIASERIVLGVVILKVAGSV